MSGAVLLDRETLDLGDLDLSALESATGGLTSYERTEPSQVADRIHDASIVIVNKVVLDAEILARCPSLRLICVIATGVNNIDTAAARAQGITVVNCQAYGTDSVAQHTLTLMLALATQLIPYRDAVRAGRWEQAPNFCFLDYPIIELAGRRLLVVGHGELGSAVARLAEAFGMEVLIAERPGSTEARPGRVLFEEALPTADFVTLHCPLTDQTRNLINAETLRAMKTTAFVINTARGGIVNEADLAEALRLGEIAGAGMDVLTQEPPRDGNPLLAADIPNLIVTPHSAWGSRTARQRIVDQTVENIAAWQAGEPIRVVTA
ncbi:MAG: 2-hydroxyacid dehydrogenase [Spiribacter sp.]|nr:2-hydroxyacid dehydrogenase [Spiribacter sp.]